MNDEIFEQECADYLNHLGIAVEDGQRINAPYRSTADSESFHVTGNLFYDFSHGEGGSVWDLALRMHDGDRREALRSLHEAAGVPFVEQGDLQGDSDRGKARAALAKVREAFQISDKTPSEAREYLVTRMVTEKSRHLFAFIPRGQLAKVLSPREIELTGLGFREDLIILWYLQCGMPVYYCTRSIATKEFKKAPGEYLYHPIWNVDDLYRHPNLVWGEGMFDCTSLLELGYGVAGEITCHPIGAHLPILIKALRWRRKHHPDWNFTICLDNDALTPKTGRRPGNEAAEKLAVHLWSLGLDVKWVKHDLGATKTDINDLHQKGGHDAIRHLIASAKRVSDILPYDPGLVRDNLIRCVVHHDYKGARKMIETIETNKKDQDQNVPLKVLVDRILTRRVPYEEIYKDIELYLYDGNVYVLYPTRHYGQREIHYNVFQKRNLIDNIRSFQLNTSMEVKFEMLDIPSCRPTWSVHKDRDPKAGPLLNLFRPSAMLTQKPRGGAELPPMFSRVLQNLAGPKEGEWLLNHMAVYVQTLQKPKTIPVLVGTQGSGKTSLIELFGRGVGDFITVGASEVESSFNEWMMHAVILIDELATSPFEARQMKSKVKSLINDSQTVNRKFQNLMHVRLNNYVAIASNEEVTCPPVLIEMCDRRFTVIAGGGDCNLKTQGWFTYEQYVEQLPGFMLYLLSRPINIEEANTPLDNEKKRELMALSEDPTISVIRDWIESNRGGPDDWMTGGRICVSINDKRLLRVPLTGKRLAMIMKFLRIEQRLKSNQAEYRGIRLASGQPVAMPREDRAGEAAIGLAKAASSPASLARAEK